MSIDLTGITNKNEYYTNHYFSTIFEENTKDTIKKWTAAAKESKEVSTPWSLLRQTSKQYYVAHDKFIRSSVNMQTLINIKSLADAYLNSLGYPEANPKLVEIEENLSVPVYLEINKHNGAPLLWVLLSASKDRDEGIMESSAFDGNSIDDDSSGNIPNGLLIETENEKLINKILFTSDEPPRFVLIIGMNQIALIDRNKWNEKKYLQFELEEIFARLENTTLQAMSVLLHKESLCPEDGKVLLDELDEQSQKNASGVSQDLKYALRESIELLGNEVLYDMETRLGRNLEENPVDANQLTLECLRYMYRMLFVLFIESRPELGYAPMKAQSYCSAYSLESLRDIADSIRSYVDTVGDGYYLHDTLAKLYELIYDGYPKTEEELKKATGSNSLHDIFLIAPLKAHIFDPEYTKMITAAKLRNKCMLRIIDLMSLTRPSDKKSQRRARISYSNLGINQMGAVYEALLSYRGFIAEEDLYEVKKAGDKFDELETGYFVPESELDQYTEDERVRYESGEKKGKLRVYEKGTFIYRLAGREREKSASYYTPEVLTKCLVKYALKELLEGKTADEILELTICEPAMGSAAFLNETINQLAEAYISLKEKELGESISYEKRFNELQKVKMFIADRNVYGIDLNPVAVELAEVSLWLNTIYEGGFVPWFGTQLVNGNSLIGARRQTYRVADIQATSKGMRWYEKEPERVPLGTHRYKGNEFSRKQIYHFLLGDPGMCNYKDKVIKSLEPENIKMMNDWNKKFTEPLSDDEATTLLRLSAKIDELWEKQIELRKEIDTRTQDNLSIFGHKDNSIDSHTTIREKDRIFKELYKSEDMQNAGPYARLKFAMDYWCSLWFWPIDKAELLPSRSEFLFDMSLILEGTTNSVVVSNVMADNKQLKGQMSFITDKEESLKVVSLINRQTDTEKLEAEINKVYGDIGEVDIPALRKQNPRLDLAAKIAEQNKFMHWELEFADIFAERGGFDLIVGNPPWILLGWNEKSVLSDANPLFVIKDLTSAKVSNYRNDSLKNSSTKNSYFIEYTNISGQQNFLSTVQNYKLLVGTKTNLYKCFLPQSWYLAKECGIISFVHPETIYDDPKGGSLREVLYQKLVKHFQFVNEKKLFQEIDHHVKFSLNIYCNKNSKSFETISNLFIPKTIEECYDLTNNKIIPGLKDSNGNWNTDGHPKRIVYVGKNELLLFAKLFDSSDNWKQARLPAIHAQTYIDVLFCFANHKKTLANSEIGVCTSQMWNETLDTKRNIIEPNVHFPDSLDDLILSGPHIGIANPIVKSSRRVCTKNSDYDKVDLIHCNDNYKQRCNYSIACNYAEYYKNVAETPWGGKYTDNYRLCMRKMLGLAQERTLISTIIPPKVAHIGGIIGFNIRSGMVSFAANTFSVPFDFYLKVTGKSNAYYSEISTFPILEDWDMQSKTICRALLLNCVTSSYSNLWNSEFKNEFCKDDWSKKDSRLKPIFKSLTKEWNYELILKNDYERRQALVEIDVLTSMALGMTLEQLKTIYRIQFPVLQSYEEDTWYDANGRIVFTNNRSLVGVGFDRKTWENEVKDAPAGKKFYRKIIDDTMPGGPVERTIEYVAPFDRCDREKDYETAWKFFEEKYKYK